MRELNASERSWLEGKFDRRVSMRLTERKLYGHDIAAIPSLIRPLVGSTLPGAVVQPESEAELAGLVRWANGRGIPLTPRGKATSGYGGVLPVRGGIVVDFHRMDRVIRIDPERKTVRVEAGAVWERLDRELAAHGLTLRLYPTSYPSSTVGGWLAQGGAGIGSYEAGWFRDNVLSARVILPDGSAEEASGEALDLIADAEGTTGFVTELEIKVQFRANPEVLAVGCPTAGELQRVLASLIEQGTPLWSVLFINPRMAELKNRAPAREHGGHPAEERALLPASYVATLAFRSVDREVVRRNVERALEASGGELLSDRIARHEWNERFRFMVVKRLGPSLVPSEIVIPLEVLGEVMDEIERKVDQPVVKEGVVVRRGGAGRPEVVLLGFIPSDQRRFKYNLVFGLVLTILKIAERHGGRAYATGLYFASKADRVLGRERLDRMRAFKKRVDPGGILNPDKVLHAGAVGRALALAGWLEPLVRPFGNEVTTRIGERPGEKPVRGIPADVAWYAYACSQCGYCVAECPEFYGHGWESFSPRGKWFWLREYMEGREKLDQTMVDGFLACTTCEVCDTRCSAALPIEPSWMKLRGRFVQEEGKRTIPPFEVMGAALHKEGDIWAGYRRDRADWFPADLLDRHGPDHPAKTVYFAGCTASYVEKDIGIAGVRLLDRAGVDFAYLGPKENCCGTPMLVAGKWDLFEETLRKNLAAVREAGADTVVTSCPACDMMWRHVYPAWAKKLGIDFPIRARHYSEMVAEKIEAGTFAFPSNGRPPETVTWHDSCHLGRASGVYEAPRALIRAVPNVRLVEMEHNREEARCCGSVLTLIHDPATAAEVGKTRIDEAMEAGARKILALCPCCEFQLRVSADKKGLPVEVVDLARFVASAFGESFPDPSPEVKRQWAVFEAMIALMTPRGFADLMGTMFPELVDAMPLGMGRMMRWAGKIPGALGLAKPLFPILFPRLLPRMMPAVMPTLLRRVAERVPMPQGMAEQMPVLMPQVMDRLMPHMIGEVVPLVTPPLIAYLQGKGGLTGGEGRV